MQCRQKVQSADKMAKSRKTVCGPFGIIMRLLKKPTRDEAAEKCPTRDASPPLERKFLI